MAKAQYVPCDYIIFPGDWDLPDQGLLAWVEANGFDKDLVLADYPIVVRDEEVIAKCFIWADSEAGAKAVEVDGEPDNLRTEMVTVPLVASPEVFGITSALTGV